MNVATHDVVIATEPPVLIDPDDFTRLADDDTTMTLRADVPAVIALAIGMTTQRRRFITRPLAAGTTITIERLPHAFEGFPAACQVSIPSALTANTEEFPNGPTA